MNHGSDAMFLGAKNNLLWLVFVLLASGCLPSSCNRIESRVISPADSLSRVLAESLPVDTLQFLDTIRPGSDVLSYPRTLGYDPEGVLWVTDTARHVLLSLRPTSTELIPHDTLTGAFPYLAGFRGGSVYAFSPAFHSIYELTEGKAAREIKLSGALPEEGGLRYGIVTDSGFAVKVVAKAFDGYLAWLDNEGRITSQMALEGEEWRYAGLLRAYGEQMYSLSGYLPQIDVFTGGEQDSLALIGFDSPMLARTLLFQMGSTGQPPLLSASAVRAGEFWFVLNMRPGWTQVDVYSVEGELKYILTEPNPAFNKEYYPTDLAVFAQPDGSFSISVSLLQPEPRIDRYAWYPSAPSNQRP